MLEFIISLEVTHGLPCYNTTSETKMRFFTNLETSEDSGGVVALRIGAKYQSTFLLRLPPQSDLNLNLKRAPHVLEEWGDQARRRERVGAEPSSTDKFLTNPVHAADSDLSSERF
ncbi:hypothetical protein J6590_090075 [Homalodisca vitripennis]|nr:hypothetical protein J6590_090075 [Homalodisca vitripennis]